MLRLIATLIFASAVLYAQEPQKSRVFISDRDSWQASGGFTAIDGNAAGSYHEGVQRINTEQIKTFNKTCPEVLITSNPTRADFIVIWDTKTWQQTSWSGHQNEYAMYDLKGDLVYSGATHKLANAAKDLCKAVANQVAKNKSSSSSK